MTMRATRDALTCPNTDAPMHTALGCTWCIHTADARAEIEAMEAVAEAAQEMARFWRYPITPAAIEAKADLVDALARLAETQNGQTAGGTSENEALAQGVVDPPASTTPPPAVCSSQSFACAYCHGTLLRYGDTCGCSEAQERLKDFQPVEIEITHTWTTSDPGDCGEDCA